MPSHAGLPGVATQSADRIILHVDNDCFYAACERVREPSLEGEPVIVGMGFQPGSTGGVVATASYEAREYGIGSAQPITEAMERLPPRSQTEPGPEPTGVYRPVDMQFYEQNATAVHEILSDVSDTVRRVSIDEAYLDCSEQIDWNEAESFAIDIKYRIADELGLPVSVGVAPNMSVAKIASDHDKPDGLVVVHPKEVADFLAPLPIDALHGVGPKTASLLNERGIETVEHLVARGQEELIDLLGERGRDLFYQAQGIDSRPVTPRGDPKSLSRESSFGDPVADSDLIREKLRTLAEAVAERARRKGATYRTIGIKVVEPPFEVQTREESLPGPIDEPELVETVSLDLYEEFRGKNVRKVGVKVANLTFPEGDQRRLDSWDDGRNSRELQYHRENVSGAQLRLTAFEADSGD